MVPLTQKVIFLLIPDFAVLGHKCRNVKLDILKLFILIIELTKMSKISQSIKATKINFNKLFADTMF